MELSFYISNLYGIRMDFMKIEWGMSTHLGERGVKDYR